MTPKKNKSMEMPGFEPGASYMRSKRSTTELHPHIWILTFSIVSNHKSNPLALLLIY